ncbi:hypothetical protein HDU97_002754 [Phlyctochytrium planicorne]|nr:hypothetical protein HDU97_002754 [Phlyctochytrium planicorne]
MKILTFGGVGGQFEACFSKLATINKKHGPFDLMICCGDFFAANQSKESTEALLSGKVKVPVNTCIIRGSNRLPDEVTAAVRANNGEICENLFFLGRSLSVPQVTKVGTSGIYTTSEGLRIAYLSGVSNPEDTGDGDKEDPNRGYGTLDVDRLAQRESAQQSTPPVSVDVLVTFEWPENITSGSSNPNASLAAAKVVALNAAMPSVTDVAQALQPRYQFSSFPGIFFEREPYKNINGAVHPSRFIGLGEFGAPNKERWFYAFNIIPLSSIDRDALKQVPSNITENPFISLPKERKRQRTEEERR